MNEEKATTILGNVQQLTESLAHDTNAWIEEKKKAVKHAKEARDKALFATLNWLLSDIRCGRATSDTADAIEVIVRELIK